MTTHAKRDSLDGGVTKTGWNDSIPFARSTHHHFPTGNPTQRFLVSSCCVRGVDNALRFFAGVIPQIFPLTAE
jgi:hypothetical protein